MSLVIPVKELFNDNNRSGITSKHESWEEVKLKDVVIVQNGFAFKSDCFNNIGEGMPLVRIRDIMNGETETYYRGEYPESYVITKEDLLIGMDGDFNSALWKGRDALLNQRVCR